MSSFAMFLLEGGVDVAVAVDFEKIAPFLEEEISQYTCGEYIFKIRAGKGTLGKHWDLVINAVDPNMEGQPLFPLGRIEIEPDGPGVANLKFRPAWSRRFMERMLQTGMANSSAHLYRNY